MTDDIMTTQQAADYLKITQRAVNFLIERGTLKAEKVGIQWLIYRDSVEDYKRRKEESK